MFRMNMNAKEYQKIYDWFQRHPTANRLLEVVYRNAAKFIAVLYFGLLLWQGVVLMLAMQQGQSFDVARVPLCISFIVPAVVLVTGTMVRAIWNCPRPYEQVGFVPLISKAKKGHACPSRHALSAAVLAVVWWVHLQAVGMVLCVLALLLGAIRVLAGVHSVRDVLWGFVFGGGVGVLLVVGLQALFTFV